MMQEFAVFKPEFSNKRDVMLILEENGNHCVVTSPDQLSAPSLQREIASMATIDRLPISLEAGSVGTSTGYLVHGAIDPDTDPGVEIWLAKSTRHGKFHIIRHHPGSTKYPSDTVVFLTENSSTLSHLCNVVAECKIIDWQCPDASGDVETVCVSNAVAILEGEYGEV